MNDRTHNRWTERLSPYLDDELAEADRAEVEAHLAHCATCRGALEELRQIVSLAPAYRGTEPSRDLWAEIKGAIDRTRAVAFPAATRSIPPRRLFTLPQLLAASIAFAAVGAGAVWLANHQAGLASHESAGQVATATPGAGPRVVPAGISSRADSAYGQAILDLQSVLTRGRSKLDTATVRIIEDNLAIIDRAIAEARAAIARDPANAYLNNQVAANMRRKLDLLRRAAAAITASES